MLRLDQLIAHPDNANCMPQPLLEKLIAHIRATGHYPPLIVRPHPKRDGCYQVLDGHHRLLALKRLKYTHANCDIWNVDDQQADMLLLTLNRLQGEDDPQRRGMLLQRLAETTDISDLARQLPDDADAIARLIGLTQPPPPPQPPPDLSDMPHAVTFFLTTAQRSRLFSCLREIHPDRTQALLSLVENH